MGVLWSSDVKREGKRDTTWNTSARILIGAEEEPVSNHQQTFFLTWVFMIPKKNGRWKQGLPFSKVNSADSVDSASSWR